MKKQTTVDSARDMVYSLVGKNVYVRQNRGRNRIKNYCGVLTEAHANVFVVRLIDEIFEILSCSYTDIVCGEITVKEKSK